MRVLFGLAGPFQLLGVDSVSGPAPSQPQVPPAVPNSPPATPPPTPPAAPSTFQPEQAAQAARGSVPAVVKPFAGGLPHPFAPGDHLALVSQVLGKGTAVVEQAGPEEMRLQAVVTNYSELVKTAAQLLQLDLPPQLQTKLAIARDPQGKYSLDASLGSIMGDLHWDGLALQPAGSDQALVDSQGRKVAFIRQPAADRLTIEVPLADLSQGEEKVPAWAHTLLPKSITLELTKVGSAQDTPQAIKKKTTQVFHQADPTDRFTAGVAFGGEPIVAATLGYEHTLKSYANLARLQAGGKLFMGTQDMIAGTIGGELSLAPWNQPFFVGANLGLYTGNYGPDHRYNIGVGPELKAGWEKGPWQATVSYTHVWGTTGINLFGVGMGYKF